MKFCTFAFLPLLSFYFSLVVADRIILDTSVNEYKSKITLPSNEKLEMIFNNPEKINLTIISGNPNTTINALIYTDDGKKLTFKSTIVHFIGKITYLEIENDFSNENKMKIYWNIYTYSLFDSLLSLIAMCSFVSLMIFDNKSYVVRCLLVLLLVMEVYRSPDIINMGIMIKRSILRIR